jgi:hypothetical protein
MNLIKQGTCYEEFLEQINARDIEWFKRDHFGRIHFAWVSLNKKCHPLIRFRKFEQKAVQKLILLTLNPFLHLS